MSAIMPLTPLEIVFSFDTTGSMFRYLEEIREKLRDLIQRLQADIPTIRVSVMAHGDYCDAASSYVTKFVDLTTDVVSLCDFVRNVARTGGGDAPECYELVLRQVRTQLSWTADSRRALVIIGDNLPHEADYPQNKLKIDWKEEVRSLAADSVTIYAVQCGNVREADPFFQTMADATDGKRLQLAEMTSLFDLMMAVCYRESDNPGLLLSGYEKEVRARGGQGGIAKDIDAIFAALRDNNDAPGSICPPSAAPKLSKKTSSLTKLAKPATVSKSSKVKARSSLCTPNRGKKGTERRAKESNPAINKFHEKNLPLLKRENVPERNFSLRWLNWSQWCLAIANQKDISTQKVEQYVKRNARPGYRLKTLSHLSLGKTTQAVFEVAIQGPGSNKRRHVVFSAFSRKCLVDSRWESRLLRPVASQIDRAVDLDCKVFIRFCLLRHPKKVFIARTAVQKYDYAWKTIKQLRPGARRAEKAGLLISQ